ncbi:MULTISPECIES: carbohydrate ABC transporter permease [unclassified Brenneria]|uniref:carbohydrate ABC transporter permease n=1 Tax=unclassified Brenneria TaxID=2634434 RepID=UPI0018F0BCD4|nr:carbohydrate ABC transporter permease [Brenneria sp. L3-3C-1]MBJ7220961.1 carbohydrate ABC transporter permease [Brenneria sp. L3-3C-1]MEE3642202.1 carbohydrate ABC transporter permease [Brenneria sp. L3_3C_1]
MQLIKYLLISVLALTIAVPLMMMVTISLNPDNTDILRSMGGWRAFIPRHFSLDNYAAILADTNHPFGRYIFNTALITAVTLTLSLLINSAAAFSLAWGQGKHRAALLALIVALLAIPGETLVLSQLFIVSRVGILDTYLVQIIPCVANAFFIFLFYQFFSRIPRDLIDAARVDGFSLFRTWLNVGLPLSKPVFVTVATLQFLGSWNSYLWPIMVTRGPEVRPLSVAMSAYFGSNQLYWGNIMAFAVMMALPVMLFFLLVQRHFIASITGSAVKE